jgi:hypothetical protein
MALSVIEERVAGAKSLPALLDAAYEAFEAMLAVIRAHDDPGSGLFVPMVMAGAQAAAGRDRVGWAPSLPPRGLRRLAAGRPDETGPFQAAGTAATWLAGLCRVLAGRLDEAAALAADPGDQDRCAGAAGCAREIALLMGDPP